MSAKDKVSIDPSFRFDWRLPVQPMWEDEAFIRALQDTRSRVVSSYDPFAVFDAGVPGFNRSK